MDVILTLTIITILLFIGSPTSLLSLMPVRIHFFHIFAGINVLDEKESLQTTPSLILSVLSPPPSLNPLAILFRLRIFIHIYANMLQV